MASKNLNYSITAQDKGASKALQGVEHQAGTSSAKIAGAFSKMGSAIGGEFGAVLDKVSEGLTAFGEAGGHTGMKLAAAGAGVMALGAEFMNLSSGEKAAHQQLDAAIQATGHSWDEYGNHIEEAIKHGENYGHTAADTQNALQRLTEATDDPAKALEKMGLVEDIAAAKHTDLATAANMLALGMTGSARVFKQFGVVLDTSIPKAQATQKAIDQLSVKLKGQAAAASDTFAGKIKSLQTHLGDFAAMAGGKVGPALTVLGPVMMAAGTAMQFMESRAAKAAVAQAALAAANTAEGASTGAVVEGDAAAAAANEALAGSAAGAGEAMGAKGLLGSLKGFGVAGVAAAAGAYAESKAFGEAKKQANEHGKAVGFMSGALDLMIPGLGTGTGKILDMFGAQKQTTDSGYKLAVANSVEAASALLQLRAHERGAAAMLDAKNAASVLSTTLDGLSNNEIGGATSALQYADSLAGLTQQVKDNGSSLDATTAKGRSNQEALLGLIQANNANAEATFKATGSTAAMGQALASGEAELRRSAVAAGYNATEIDAMIRKYHAVPGKIYTALELNTIKAYGALAGFLTYVQNNSSVQLDLNVLANRASIYGSQAPKGARASGGPVYPGATYRVNERGVETLTMGSTGGYVHPAGNGSGSVTVIVQGSVISQDDLVRAVQTGIDANRRRHGNHTSILKV